MFGIDRDALLLLRLPCVVVTIEIRKRARTCLAKRFENLILFRAGRLTFGNRQGNIPALAQRG